MSDSHCCPISIPLPLRRQAFALPRWVVVLCCFLTTVTSIQPASASKASLVFQAQCQLLSDPICDDPDALREFLERPVIRNLFLSGGGRRPCHSLEVPPDSDVADLWRQACRQYYGNDALPEVLCTDSSDSSKKQQELSRYTTEDTDITALVTETEVQFPGFKAINAVLNGCRLVPSGYSKTKPNEFFATGRRNLSNDNCQKRNDIVHMFYLVGDKKRWVGPAPVVWIVRKLTGDDGTQGAGYSPSETRAISQVSIYSRDEEDDGAHIKQPTVGFQIDIDCAVHVEFPKLLLRLLPAPQSKVEQRGTQAIRKVILEDARNAIQAVEEAWVVEQQGKNKPQNRVSKRIMPKKG